MMKNSKKKKQKQGDLYKATYIKWAKQRELRTLLGHESGFDNPIVTVPTTENSPYYRNNNCNTAPEPVGETKETAMSTMAAEPDEYDDDDEWMDTMTTDEV